MDIKEITKLAHDIHEKELLIAELDAFIKSKKKVIKEALEEKEMMECIAGDLAIVLKNVPETMIADTDAMKAAGIFDDYSKPKKGYTSVTIKEIKA